MIGIKKIDIQRSIFLNYEGQSIYYYIFSIVSLIIPMILYFLFKENLKVVSLIIGSSGLIGIIFINRWIEMINKMFLKRKYYISKVLR